MNDPQDMQNDAQDPHNHQSDTEISEVQSDDNEHQQGALTVQDYSDSDDAFEIETAKRVLETALLCASSPMPLTELRKLLKKNHNPQSD